MQDVLRIIVLLAMLPIVGMLGFWIIEDWRLFDAFYMAVITITTVGYMEVHPLSDAGRAFVILYLIIGLGVFFFGIVQLGEAIVRVELREWMEKRRMSTAIKSMSKHFIICGFGRMGRALSRALYDRRLPFVILDKDENVLTECHRSNYPVIIGDATDDRILKEAGIDRARGLAAVLSSDADNLYVVLSSRLLCPNLFIVSRAVDEASVEKLQKAGANRVISLFATSATRMAQLLSNPTFEDFSEIFTADGAALELAELHITEGGPYAGLRLDQTDFRKKGVIIVGIRQGDGKLVVPPPSTATIQAGDRLIAFGPSEAIVTLTG